MGRKEDGGSKAGTATEALSFTTESTEGLRIAAIFIILSAGLLGGVPPLLIKSLRNQDSLPTFLIRGFSAGVILALALVHILPDAIEGLVNVGGVDYPLGGICVLVGLFAMVFIEHGAHLMHDLPKHHAHGSTHSHDHQGQQGQSHGHAHGRGHDRSHGGSHRGAARGGARDAGLSAGQPLLATAWSEEAPGCDVGSAGEPKDGCVHMRAHAGAQQGPLIQLPVEQQQQQRGDAAPCERVPEQQLQAQAPSEQGPGLDGKEEHCHRHHQHAVDVTPCDGAAAAAARREAGAAVGTSAGTFARHSAGPSLFPAAAAQLPAPPPEAPRPLAASSLPLFQVKELNIGSKMTMTAGKDGDPISPSAAAAAGDSPVTPAAASAVLLHCPSSHCHDCVSRASAPNWVSVVEASSEATSSFRLRIIAYLFELGCIFHSFIIGLSLGVNQTDLSQVRALLIAVSFHQALEGLSLASVINGGGFSRVKAFAMVVTYSITCPLGVAIGIAIASSYDPDSDRARGAQGSLNGISAGMLLYISLVQLVAEDMGKYLVDPSAEGTEAAGVADTDTDPHADAAATLGSGLPCGHGHGVKNAAAAKAGGRDGRVGCRIRAPSFAAFCLGAASMCLLAVWA